LRLISFIFVISLNSLPLTATGVKTYKCIHCKTTKQVTIKKCEKYKNTIVVKGKKVSVKFSSLKKKNKSIARKDAISVNKAKGRHSGFEPSKVLTVPFSQILR